MTTIINLFYEHSKSGFPDLRSALIHSSPGPPPHFLYKCKIPSELWSDSAFPWIANRSSFHVRKIELVFFLFLLLFFRFSRSELIANIVCTLSYFSITCLGYSDYFGIYPVIYGKTTPNNAKVWTTFFFFQNSPPPNQALRGASLLVHCIHSTMVAVNTSVKANFIQLARGLERQI